MKLTIKKIYNRIKVMQALRKIDSSMNLEEARALVDSCSPTAAIIKHSVFMNTEVVNNLLGDSADFSYEEEDDENNWCPGVFGAFPCDSEQEEYLLAIQWFSNLSDEDKKKVKCLIQHSMPRA